MKSFFETRTNLYDRKVFIMKLDEIESVVKVFDAYQLTHLELEQDHTRLCIKRESSPSIISNLPAPSNTIVPIISSDVNEVSEIPSSNYLVKAPMVGIFYTSQSPESAPFVTVGSTISKGDVLGLIEAMKMMNEITAPVSGVIKSIKGINETLVSYDDILFEIEESNHVS